MPPSLERVQIGHMGCYAAVPGLAVVADAAVARARTAVLLCVELSSLHVQPPSEDMGQVVAHALFSDAAAAVVVRPGGPGLEIVDLVACTDPAHAELLRWDITDHGFRLHLSPEIPAAIEAHVAPMVADLLAGQGLETADVAGWAIHPGGARIVDRIGEKLALDDEALGLPATCSPHMGTARRRRCCWCSSASWSKGRLTMVTMSSVSPSVPVSPCTQRCADGGGGKVSL